MTPTPTLSRPTIELPHLRRSSDYELDSQMTRMDNERVVADAEAFHKNVPGIDPPTSTIGRRHLATKYPSQYPQWSHLVGKGAGKPSGARQGQHAQDTATARRNAGSNARRGNRGGYPTTTSGRGRGRGNYTTIRRGNRDGPVPNGQRPVPNPPSSSSLRPASTAQGLVNGAPPMTPRPVNRVQANFNKQAKTSRALPAGPPISTGRFERYEEWHSDKSRRELEQEEKEAAMLLEENEKALYVDLPTPVPCDIESLSSRSMSTEPVSERSGALPQYPLLEPMRKTPSSIASSSRVSPTRTTRVLGVVPALPVLEPNGVAPTEPKEVKKSSLVTVDDEVEETKRLVPGLTATLGFQAPDWRARGKTEPQSSCLSDTASDDSASEKGSKTGSNPGETEDINEITAAWDRALLE